MQPAEEKKKPIDKKAELLRCARALFSANGFKDTSVADITKMAGVAAGTFYLYYASKDRLFMELFLEENLKLKQHILASVDLEGEPSQVIQELIRLNMSGMYANPILKEWYNREVFTRIEQNFRAENGLEQVDFLYHHFIEIVEKWQAQGRLRSDIDSGMIMAMFSAIITIDTHKEEIGLQYFPDLQKYLTDFVLQGLASSDRQAQEGKHEVG